MSKNILLDTQESASTSSSSSAEQNIPNPVNATNTEKPQVVIKTVRFDEEKLISSAAEALTTRTWIKAKKVCNTWLKKINPQINNIPTELAQASVNSESDPEEESEEQKKAAAEILEQQKKEARLDEIAAILNCNIIKKDRSANDCVLDLKAKPGFRNIDNRLLHLAARVKNVAIVDELIALDADVNALNRDNVSPIGFACSSANVTIFQKLADAGAKTDLLSISSKNLFHFLCALSTDNPQDQEERLQIAQLLINRKLDQQQPDKNGKTPVQFIPEKANFTAMVELLAANRLHAATNLATEDTTVTEQKPTIPLKETPESSVTTPEAQSFQPNKEKTMCY